MEKGKHNSLLFTSEFNSLVEGGIPEKDVKFYGFNLGSDFCSEHEWGIKDLIRDFGVPPYIKNGLKNMTITKNKTRWGDEPTFEELEYDGKKFKVLAYPRSPSMNRFAFSYEPEEFHSAWDGRGFAIAVDVTNTKVVKHLTDLFEAIQKKKMCFMKSSGASPFSNAGLVLAIVDRLPKEFDEYLKNPEKFDLEKK